MLFRLIKKITKNYGIFLSLLLGVILSLVVINCTVMYGNSLKDSLFQKLLSSYEITNDTTAGAVNIEENTINLINGFSDTKVKQDLLILEKLNMDIKSGRSMAIAEHSIYWNEVDDVNRKDSHIRNYDLISMKDFEDHIDIVQGRIFEDTYTHEDKNIVEVVVDQKTKYELKLEINKLYRMELVDEIKHENILNVINGKIENKKNNDYFKIVGVYKLKEDDFFWRKGNWNNEKNNFVINAEVLHKLYVNSNGRVKANREYFIDFSKFRYSDRDALLARYKEVEDQFIIGKSQFKLNIYQNLIKAENKNFKLVGNMLWIIQVPVFAILFLYILMITGIIIERDKDEIALLKSRGATKFNILSNYLFDGVMILIVGLIIAPVVSLIATKYMSTTSGFLEFDGEFSKNIYFSKENIYLSVMTSVFFIGALLLPVIKATKEGIINRKQSKVRAKFSTWKKTFVDFILIGIGLYGFSLFSGSKDVVSDVKLDINYVTLDPLIFISATVFTFGLSLLFLRVYPYLISFIFKTLKKIMPAHIFVLFSNLGRKAGKREYVMLFIMVMICSSIFNLKIARTINTNLVDNLKYTSGSELKIKGIWLSDKSYAYSSDSESGGGPAGDPIFDVNTLTELIEPDYSQYESLNSLEAISKVLTIKNTTVWYEEQAISSVDFMSVEPKEFGEIAYMRDDLSQYHWYNYLNVLAANPNVVYLSSNIDDLDKYDLKSGDVIEVDIYGFREELVFGGFIDYWPGYKDKSRYLMVGNFDYAYSRLARLPYEIWGTLKKDKTKDDLLEEIEAKSVNMFTVSSISEFTKENIFLKAVNSSISISFILSLIITLLGFIIYWTICIKERELQFGILRSLGLKKKKLYMMIGVEQLLVTGTSLLVGIGIGQFISGKFLPVITEIVFGDSLVLPIFDYIASSDYILIVTIFLISVVLVLFIILRYISNLKMGQAIKIGED